MLSNEPIHYTHDFLMACEALFARCEFRSLHHFHVVLHAFAASVSMGELEGVELVRPNSHLTQPPHALKIKRTDIGDGALWIVQNKTGARLGIEITGDLAAVIERINQRPRKAISAFLIQDENGQPLSQGALRTRFDKAGELAKVEFQFRDIGLRL